MNLNYVCARVLARKGKLFTREEYLEMSNMNLEQLLEFLSKSTYRNAIAQTRGEILERIHIGAVRGYAQELMEVYRFLGKLRKKLYPLFMHLDLQNFLTLLRGKAAGMEKNEMEKLLVDAPLSPRILISMYNLPTEEIILSFRDHPLIKDVKPEKKLKEMEKKIFLNYLKNLKKLALIAGLKGYAELMLEAYDALNLIKAKIYGEEIELVTRKWRKMQKAGIDTILGKISEEFGVGGGLVDMESGIEAVLLRNAIKLMRKKLMGVGTLVGYLKAKEAESRNIRIIASEIAEGKRGEEVMEELII